MAVATCFGLAPLLFRKKSSGYEGKGLAETNQKPNASKNQKQLKGLTVRNSCSVAGNFIKMTELWKKISNFRDLIDLTPCVGSASVHELVIETLKELHQLYPDIIPRASISKMEGTSIHQALASFCEALKSIGEMWMNNNDWMPKCKYDPCDRMSNNDLEQFALVILDDMIKMARERLFDMMDEDDQMKDYTPRANAFESPLSDSYSDNKTPFSCSPATPTSVLPEMTARSAKVGASGKSPYSSSLSLPFRVQAIGKLSPIDVKRLSFHMLPHLAAQDYNILKQMDRTVGELKPEREAKSDKTVNAAGSVEVSKNCNITEVTPKNLMTNCDKIGRKEGRHWIGNQNIPPMASQASATEAIDEQLPKPSLSGVQPRVVAMVATPPATLHISSNTIVPAPAPLVSSDTLPSPPLPPSPPTSSSNAAELSLILPTSMLPHTELSPPQPRLTTTSSPTKLTSNLPSSSPSVIASENKTTPSLPQLPPLSMTSKSIAPQPPTSTTLGNPTMQLPLPLPPPLPSPIPPTIAGNTARLLPPPPPPPPTMSGNMATPLPPQPPPTAIPANGSASLPPPPMPFAKGVAPPPPPAFGGANSLRPKKAATKLKRSSQMGSLYRLLKGKVEGTNLDGKSLHGRRRTKIGSSTGGKQGMADALAEMTKRSSYFQQIEEDVKNHAKSIMEIKSAINSFQTTDMAEILKFHKHVETYLEKLSDESQVLARFEGFPVKKLEALRMAAALHSKLDAIVNDLQKWKIEAPLGQLLDKAENYLNKIKGYLDGLERTKEEEAKKFQSQKIHFDFSILLKIKELIVDVSSGCMELALKERREAKAKENVEGGSKTEVKKKGFVKMLWRVFQFAFRVYTFAGGQDDCADRLRRELAHEIESDPHH